jgi:hypothetical protein
VKIIFSRKGFDTEKGGVASPIFPDRRICSLPIPDRTGPVRYKDIQFGRTTLGRVVHDLTVGRANRYTGNHHAHLDPDLRKEAIPRREGWLPAFGQRNQARTLLAENGVGIGDIFLFFGWFRRVEDMGGHLRFAKGQPDIHLLWGWLQVGQVFQETSRHPKLPLWASFHPHVGENDDWRAEGKVNNTLFVAAKRLKLPGRRLQIPGAGVYTKYHPVLQLTEPGKSRRNWRLPAWIYPGHNKPPLTYHRDKKRWKKDERGVVLRTVSRGQEFVLDTEYYPQAYKWLAGLFKVAAS